MRVSRSAGGLGAAALQRPLGGRLGRIVEAVPNAFAPRDTFDFTPVDGVYRPDSNSGRRGARGRIEVAGRVEAHRLYNARAGTDYVWTGAKGGLLNVRA